MWVSRRMPCFARSAAAAASAARRGGCKPSRLAGISEPQMAVPTATEWQRQVDRSLLPRHLLRLLFHTQMIPESRRAFQSLANYVILNMQHHSHCVVPFVTELAALARRTASFLPS